MTKLTLKDLCEQYMALLTLQKLGHEVSNQIIEAVEEIRDEADRILL